MTEDQKVQHGYSADQLKHRARQGGLVWEKTRQGARMVDTRLMDMGHARLLQNLTAAQQQAMIEIGEGFNALTAGVSAKAFDPNRVGGKPTESDKRAQQAMDYMKWAQEVVRRKVSHAMAMDIIAYGMSAREVARARRVRNEVPLKNLRVALNIFCKMRGWQIGKV